MGSLVLFDLQDGKMLIALQNWFDQAVLTTSSPQHATVKLTDLSPGKIPYHVSDAAGLADSAFLIGSATSFSFATGLVYVESAAERKLGLGVDSSAYGLLTLLSLGAGSAIGGRIDLVAATDYRVAGLGGFNTWTIQAYENDVRVGGNQDSDAFIFTYEGDFNITAGSLIASDFTASTLIMVDADKKLASVTLSSNLSLSDSTLNLAAAPSVTRLTLTQTTGTAPLTITSTTVNTNLNADLLDGQHIDYFTPLSLYTSLAADVVSLQTLSHSAVTIGANATDVLSSTNQVITFDNQNANTFLAGPTSGAAAAPTMRAMVAADMPAATTSAQGAAELATDTETLTGTDTGRVITPSNLASITQKSSNFVNAEKWQLIASLCQIITPANIILLFLCDETGAVTVLTDKNGFVGNTPHTVSLVADDLSTGVNASAMTPGVTGLAPFLTLTSTATIKITDAADLSIPGGFSTFILGNTSNLNNANYFFSKYDQTTALGTRREWGSYVDTDGTVYFRVYDNSVTNCYVGRASAASAVAINTLNSLVCTWNGGVLSAGAKIYQNGSAIDSVDSENNAASFVAMEDTTAPLTMCRVATTGAAAGCFIGKLYIGGLVSGVLTALQTKQLDTLIRAWAGVAL